MIGRYGSIRPKSRCSDSPSLAQWPRLGRMDGYSGILALARWQLSLSSRLRAQDPWDKRPDTWTIFELATRIARTMARLNVPKYGLSRYQTKLNRGCLQLPRQLFVSPILLLDDQQHAPTPGSVAGAHRQLCDLLIPKFRGQRVGGRAARNGKKPDSQIPFVFPASQTSRHRATEASTLDQQRVSFRCPPAPSCTRA